MDDVPKIKGAAIREFVLWYERTCGSEILGAALAKVPMDERSGLRSDIPGLGVLASSWYPASLCNALLDAASEGQSDEEIATLAREGSHAIVDVMLYGIYRFLFERVSTPARYARHIGRLWRQLHSSGERSIQLAGPNEADSIITSWPAHHPLMCLITMETMGAVFEAMRCRDVTVERTACVSRGDPDCRAYLTWRGP